jgi:CheY-like chemotaxis protein
MVNFNSQSASCCCTAVPPPQALEYLLHKCTVLPDLVLLDVMMPTMSGYEVATRIRDIYPSSLLPIIMVRHGDWVHVTCG